MSTDRIALYRRIALLLAIVGGVVFLGAAFYFGHVIGGPVSGDADDWAKFGSFIGGFAGAAVSLLALIALAMTLHLQAKEMQDTSAALQAQAKASQEQLETTRKAEAWKIRPLVKAEWLPIEGTYSLEWRIRNVGLGPCILDRIEVYLGAHREQVHGGEYGAGDASGAAHVWEVVISQIPHLPQRSPVRSAPMHDLKRALGPGEPQQQVVLDFSRHDLRMQALSVLDGWTLPVIHFRALSGERLCSRDQFDNLGQ